MNYWINFKPNNIILKSTLEFLQNEGKKKKKKKRKYQQGTNATLQCSSIPEVIPSQPGKLQCSRIMSIGINWRPCQQAVITYGLLSTPKSPFLRLDNLHFNQYSKWTKSNLSSRKNKNRKSRKSNTYNTTKNAKI